jgi:hypothetical protein
MMSWFDRAQREAGIKSESQRYHFQIHQTRNSQFLRRYDAGTEWIDQMDKTSEESSLGDRTSEDEESSLGERTSEDEESSLEENSMGLGDDIGDIFLDQPGEFETEAHANIEAKPHFPKPLIPWEMRWILTFIMLFKHTFNLTEVAVVLLLRFIGILYQYWTKRNNFPTTLHLVRNALDIHPHAGFDLYAVCRKCHALYNLQDIAILDDDRKTLIPKTCSNRVFSHHQRRSLRGECGEPLGKQTKFTRKILIKPNIVYPYHSLLVSLQEFLIQPDFESACERWRARHVPPGVLGDIYDGRLWSEFLDSNGGYFFKKVTN